MDKCIVDLKSTTFSGKRFTRKQITTIQETVRTFPALSRRELAHTICEHLQWYTPKGENRIQSCLSVLDSLECLGILSLPPKEASKKRGPQRRIPWTSQSAAQAGVNDDLAQLTPIRLLLVTEKAAISQWNEYVDRHHYLGYKRPIGPHLRYFILDKRGRRLGCLMFSYAVKSLACRDEWIGWQEKTHKKHLDLVINNNRFLIFPWVKVKYLASKALSIAARQLANDWQGRYGYRPVLMETFVDLTKFDATCYRAANWHYLGQTKGRTVGKNTKGKTQKGVYVYPLAKNAKSILINGPKAAAKTSQKPSIGTPKPLRAADPFVQLWQHIIDTVIAVAHDFDHQWQKRRRVLNTLFRMKTKAGGAVDGFIASGETDTMVEIIPTRKGQIGVHQIHPGRYCEPISLRLVKYTVAGTTYILGATLFDRQRYPIEDLAQVYHSRWGIEELYKISKQLMTIEDFHGQSERGVKQELFAHFVLITLTRIFSNHSEDRFNPHRTGEGEPHTKANFKNCLMKVARNIDSLLLQQATLLSETINRIVASISICRQKLRPNRSYDRRSRKPIGKWKSPNPAKPIGKEIRVAL